jgi:hypothetical protein
MKKILHDSKCLGKNGEPLHQCWTVYVNRLFCISHIVESPSIMYHSGCVDMALFAFLILQ